MNIILQVPLEIINAVICFALSAHGVCVTNHFNRSTPFLMRFGVAVFTAACVGVAIGPFFGIVTTDPLEVIMNAGLLTYCMRKELLTYMTGRRKK